MHDWKAITIEPNAPLTKAIEVLNSTGMLFLIVVDAEGKLIGNLTDGDLRKGLIKHHGLGITVLDVMNKNTSYVFNWQPESAIKDVFKNPSIKAVPVVNDNHFVVGCYFAEEFSNRNTQSARLLIMAGGFGRRMGDLTKDRPKPMLLVKGVPILERIVQNASKQGFKKITISTHFMADKITSYFKDGKSFGVEIEYIHENEPLGTAGCVGQIKENVDTLLVVNGDIYSEINFRSILDYHKLTSADATMATHEHEIINPYGVVQTEGISIVGLDEKPVWKTNVNAGVYVINGEMRRYVKPGEKVDMTDLFTRLVNANCRAVMYPLEGKMHEIGSPENYHLANLI